MNTKQYQYVIDDSLAAAGVRSPEGAAECLARHFTDLLHWNRRVNLTRITDPAAAAWLLYADSAMGAVELDPGDRVLDIGSGAGFPGLVLAVLRPDCHVTLLDAVAKKVEFLRYTARNLALANVDCYHGRWPEFELANDTPAATASRQVWVSRATFSDPAALQLAAKRLRPADRLILWRGSGETQALAGFTLHLRSYRLEALRDLRHLCVYTKEELVG